MNQNSKLETGKSEFWRAQGLIVVAHGITVESSPSAQLFEIS